MKELKVKIKNPALTAQNKLGVIFCGTAYKIVFPSTGSNKVSSFTGISTQFLFLVETAREGVRI